MSHLTFNAPSPEDLERLLPAYDFEYLIAKGGMGTVYKARQRALDRDVAIKILPQELGQDPLFRQSFEIEARAMARLNHPNLIGVYDYGSVNDMLYIVMEYVPGKSLYHSSYGKMVDPVQAAQLIQGICAGLGHAHENGIVHRDIKPANILLTPKAEPKIGDFGLAHPVESEGTGLLMGTPGYTAPEVITNPRVADRRSDLFAVGVILYELMTGQRQEDGAPPPSSRCGCGPGIDAIWQRATHPNPQLRYPDAQTLSAALADWLVKFVAKGASAKNKAVLLAASRPGKIPVLPLISKDHQAEPPANPPPPANPLPANPPPANPLPANPLPANPLPANPLPANPLPANPLPANPLPANPLPSAKPLVQADTPGVKKTLLVGKPPMAGKPLAVGAPKDASDGTAVSDDPTVGDSPTVVAPQVDFQVGANWTFIRNLFIIAVLIVVVAVVWKKLEVVRAQREAANRTMLEEEARKTAKAEVAVKQAVKQAKAPVVPDKPVPPPEPKVAPPPPETPLESLERLRIDLVNGKREDMPIGTVRRGDIDFFYVPTPMTWSDAAWYAERFGGHLPIPNSPEDISWFAQKAPPQSVIWIGAGRSGRNAWSSIDGTFWKLPTPPRGIGTHVGVDDLGLVKGLDSKCQHPFIIQWHRDGSNPASIAAALLATRESLTQANPVYPPGTETFEGRNYLYVARPISWRDAAELAEKSGGQLAVISDKTEMANLASFASTLVAPNGIWLGGFYKDKTWSWITGEPWTAPNWAAGVSSDKDASGVLLRPDKGLDVQNLSTLVSGFIIEWSKERDVSPVAPKVTPGDGGNVETLGVRAKELVLGADKKRSEQLAANVRSFNWELDLWSRSLSRAEMNIWQLHLAKLKAAARNFRVPTSIPSGGGIRLSPQMAKIATNCAQKQEQIDVAFLTEVNKLRVVYLEKLRNAIVGAERDGQRERAKSLNEAFKLASDNEAWIRSFGIDPKPAAPTVEPE